MDKEAHNERRDAEHADLRRLYELMEQTRRECQEGHDAVAASQQKMESNQAVLASELHHVRDELKDIKETVIPIRSKVAVHDKDIQDADKERDTIFRLISEDRKELRDYMAQLVGTDGTLKVKPVMQLDPRTLLGIGGFVIALMVLFLIAQGLMTPGEAGDLIPMSFADEPEVTDGG